MKETDYSKIAPLYDANQIRLKIPRDKDLEKMIAGSGGKPVRVLDLACGTGNYLLTQVGHFKSADVEWFGIDKSKEMLDIARGKIASADLSLGGAESLPYKSDFFDFITCNFAFHHFKDKYAVLDQLARTIHPDGTIRIRNMNPCHMSYSWVHRFFHGTSKIDTDRFWPHTKLYSELEKRGFSVTVREKYTMTRVSMEEILKEAENRDMSQLHLISEKEYQAGLARIVREMKRGVQSITSDFAVVVLRAVMEPG